MAKKAAKHQRRVRAASVLGASAELVRQAAVILDQEMAVGVTAAKAVQQRLARERRIEPADFREAMQRFQSDARDIVNSLNAQVAGEKLNQNVELAKRFITRASDMIDLAVGVVTTSTELANELIHANLTKTNAGRTRKRR